MVKQDKIGTNKKIQEWPADHVERRSVESLIPYARNARTHSDAQVAQLAASIQEWGWTTPVLIDETGSIIAGHGRVMAARKLGIEDVPVMVAAGWSEAQRRAYVLADNQLATNAGWDVDLLKVELGDLGEMGFDLDLIGFDNLGDLLAEETEGLTDPDDVPETPAEPVTMLGDVWTLGRHRLMCGDSTSIDAVDRLTGEQSWDVCVFDPPYEIEHLYKDAMPAHEPGKKLLVMWDFKRFAIAPAAALAAGWPSQYEFIWDCVQSWYTPNRPLQRHKSIGYFSTEAKFNTDTSIINDGKDRGSKRTVKNTRGSSEYTPMNGAKHIATVESFPNTAQKDEHGHGKPVEWITAIFNGIGGVIYLDLFGGSGSTLIACEKTARDCRMMELDPKYCDVIIQRWQNFTGQKAIHAETGKTFDEMSNG
jgi:DNA modification methylase